MAHTTGELQLTLSPEERNLLAQMLRPTLHSTELADRLHATVVGDGPTCPQCRHAGLAVELDADHCAGCATHLNDRPTGEVCPTCLARQDQADHPAVAARR